MKRLIKTLITPSLRLNMIVICGVVALLGISLGVMFYFSHKAVHEEARSDAEQTLEGTVQHVDNILLSVEQATTNINSEMAGYLDQPERMQTFCRKLVECNPNIVGAAICFRPDYFPGRKLFMTYIHHKGGFANGKMSPDLVVADRYGHKPYTEYTWYRTPMDTKRPCWTDPQPEEEDEGVTLAYCQPITDRNHECVGVLVADVSVDYISQQVLTNEATPNQYSILMASDGTFIVHPDQKTRAILSIQELAENDKSNNIQKIADAMLGGETGYLPFQHNGKDWYVFYKPFLQTEVPNQTREKLNWSIGVAYSENEVFGAFKYLLTSVLIIAVLGLLLLYLLCRFVMRRQLKPLRQLTHATNRIAEGHYDEPIPEIKLKNEIGLLYDHFLLMKQSLAARVNELNQVTGTLKNRREIMHEIYAKEQSIDRMKTSFLHHVTNQMIDPAKDIERYVKSLCGGYQELSPEERSLVVDSIDKKGDNIIELINQMLNTADYNYDQTTP